MTTTLLFLAACNTCPKGLERYYDPVVKQYHCVDVAAEAKKQVEEEERQRRVAAAAEEDRRQAEKARMEAERQRQDRADKLLFDKLERNFLCRQKGLKGCDLEEMIADESREFVRWKARQRLRLRGRQGLSEFERSLLQD